jgi:hypothetical protein
MALTFHLRPYPYLLSPALNPQSGHVRVRTMLVRTARGAFPRRKKGEARGTTETTFLSVL